VTEGLCILKDVRRHYLLIAQPALNPTNARILIYARSNYATINDSAAVTNAEIMNNCRVVTCPLARARARTSLAGHVECLQLNQLSDPSV